MMLELSGVTVFPVLHSPNIHLLNKYQGSMEEKEELARLKGRRLEM